MWADRCMHADLCGQIDVCMLICVGKSIFTGLSSSAFPIFLGFIIFSEIFVYVTVF